MNSTRTWAAHAVLALAGLACAAPAHAGPYSSLVVFGDSLSDIGNDYAITGGGAPTAAYYTDGAGTVGRFSNGKNYVDHLASSLGLTLLPSQRGGTDYAYGGARTTYVSGGLSAYGALGFNQQVGAYLGSHASADPHGLYLLWIGSNDLTDAIGRAATGDSAAIGTAMSTTLQGIGNAISGLAAHGAQHFLIPNVPDLSLTPGVREFDNPALSVLAQTVSQTFNERLGDLLAQPALGALDIRTLDVYAAQTAITLDPAHYGFSDVTSACFSGDVDGSPRGSSAVSVCANPGSHMYWDYEHPTAALHAVLGELALASAVPEPATWAIFGIGLALLGAAGRRRPG
jgi:phospholipase/lecithinase/hemolysin